MDLLTDLGHSEIISICWGQLVLRIIFVSQLIPCEIFPNIVIVLFAAQVPAKQLFHFIIRIVEAACKVIKIMVPGQICVRDAVRTGGGIQTFLNFCAYSLVTPKELQYVFQCFVCRGWVT